MQRPDEDRSLTHVQSRQKNPQLLVARLICLPDHRIVDTLAVKSVGNYVGLQNHVKSCEGQSWGIVIDGVGDGIAFPALV